MRNKAAIMQEARFGTSKKIALSIQVNGLCMPNILSYFQHVYKTYGTIFTAIFMTLWNQPTMSGLIICTVLL